MRLISNITVCIVFLISVISYAQNLHIHTNNGTDTYNLAEIDSITFDGTNDTSTTGTVTDIDGNVYQTVKIGNQWWMAENLKVTQYRNGDAIPNVTGSTEWINLSTGAYCAYDNNVTNVDTYGMLYNWYAVDDSRNIAPVGWHVASDDEWRILVEYLGGNLDAGGKMKEAGTTHWLSPNTGATNSSGFTALPGGYRNYGSKDGAFSGMGVYIDLWSATEKEDNAAEVWSRHLLYRNSELRRSTNTKRNGFSVRCVRD